MDDCTKQFNFNPEYGYAYMNRGIAKEMLKDLDGACCADFNKAAQLGARRR